MAARRNTMTVSLPGELLRGVDRARKAAGQTRSALVREALTLYLGTRRDAAVTPAAGGVDLVREAQLRALEAAAGSWRDEDHPELAGGAAAWVRELRAANEKRLERLL